MSDIQSFFHLLKKYRIIVTCSVALILLIGFYFFSVNVKKDRFKTINFDTTIRLQYKIPERMGEVFEDVSFFVSPIPSVVAIGIITCIAMIDLKKRRIRWKALLIPFLFALLVGVEIYGKDRVESPAPPFFMIKNPTTIFPKYHIVDQYSYPSGHASRALFIAGAAVVLFWRSMYRKFGIPGILGLVAAAGFSIVIISFGKIYLGHHWLSDIIGGWVLAGSFLSILLGFL